MADLKRPGPVSRDIQSDIDRTQMVEALRHGNIYEVFAKSTKFKINDFLDFFSQQWRNFKGQIVQDAEVKVMEGSYHQPDINQFPKHHRGTEMDPADTELYVTSMHDSMESAMDGFMARSGDSSVPGGKFKGMTAGESEAAEGTATAGSGDIMSAEELDQMSQDVRSEWDSFLEESWGSILDAQMMSDYQKRMGEIKQEVQRIIMLVKEGKLGPEFALIALAKVNNTKNGVLMTWLGKKAFKINESLSNVANELNDMSPMDPNYYNTLQLSKEQTRDGSFQLNLLTQDMQKVMQDVASVLESVHGMMGEMNRTRREIITKLSVQ